MTKDYLRRVHYHEPDKMGVTHHTNYIKWMEEARIDFLDQIGWSYARLEREGIVSPVIGVECRYQHPTTFDDTVCIQVGVEEFRGVKLIIRYRMVNDATGEPVLTGRTTHCFTSPEGRPIILKKQFPELDRVLRTLAEEGKEETP